MLSSLLDERLICFRLLLLFWGGKVALTAHVQRNNCFSSRLILAFSRFCRNRLGLSFGSTYFTKTNKQKIQPDHKEQFNLRAGFILMKLLSKIFNHSFFKPWKNKMLVS